jgi:hypothetical protein
MPVAARPLSERFWPKVDKVSSPIGCWLWTGAKNFNTGYGCVRGDDGKTVTTHRASWRLAGRAAPAAGNDICHRCDVRNCVNPEHLFEGSRGDNIRDAVSKGRMVQQSNPERMPRGSRHHNSKLTEDTVRSIRALAAGGMPQRAIAKRFSVAKATVAAAIHAKNWRHV